MDGRIVAREVEIVEGGFVGAHVSLVEQIHADNLALDGLAARVDILHRYHHHVVATSRQQEDY